MAVTNFAQIFDLSRSRTLILVYGDCKTQCPAGIEGLFFFASFNSGFASSLICQKSTRIENYELLKKYLTEYREFLGIKFYPALLQKGLDQQSIAGQFSSSLSCIMGI